MKRIVDSLGGARRPLRAAAAILAGVLMTLAVVAPARSATLFGLVDTGELFASDNGGVSWTIRGTLPVRDAVALVAGETSAKLFLASASGSFYRSDDAGVSWAAIAAVPASDVTGLVGYPGRLMLLTRSGSVYTSTDAGASFAAVGVVTAPDVVSGARHLGVNYTLTRTGGVYRSDDHGATWTAVGALTVSNAVEIASFGGKLYVLTGTGDLARSDDLGVSWAFVSTLSQTGITSLVAVSTELLASTRGGETAASATGTSWTWRGVIGQLEVVALASDIPAATGVGEPSGRALAFLPPWPNPSRAGVTLGFDLERDANVWVAVHDLAGRVVAEPLRGERLPSGRSLRSWEPTGLRSGVYLLRARVGDAVGTRKLAWMGGR